MTLRRRKGRSVMGTKSPSLAEERKLDLGGNTELETTVDSSEFLKSE